MSLILTAFALAAQQPSQPAQPPLRVEPSRAEVSPANELFYQDERRPLSGEARVKMRDFGRCAAERSPELAARTLRLDFTSNAYRNSLGQLTRNNERCLRGAWRMAGANLLFAGAVAEGLLAQGQAPLNVRLARAAAGPATNAYSPSDRVAVCVVRSVPDQVAALLGTDPASDDERAALQALLPAFQLCARNGPRISSNEAGIRAMLATAAYRSVGVELAQAE